MVRNNNIFSEVKQYCETLASEFDTIPGDRKQLLERLANYISARRSQDLPVELVYICTHNSRRSHFGQVWAKIAADFYGIEALTYSGGTEATSFNDNAIAALRSCGVSINSESTEKENRKYIVTYGENVQPVICFSKRYDHPDNPNTQFAAIMTCSDADENCPLVPGAEFRISTPYDDPKAADGTPEQEAVYAARCRQIACECMYVFSKVI
jgi:arsenate reductase (thioredoxin)